MVPLAALSLVIDSSEASTFDNGDNIASLEQERGLISTHPGWRRRWRKRTQM
jgi:hypothetical protein